MKIKELIDETNIKTLKTYYFNKKNKSFEDKKEAAMAINYIIFDSYYDIGDFGVEWRIVREGTHAKDIFCSFERKSDEEKIKNIFINYGFTIQKTKRGFWITGVRE